jgi:DNA-binding CsgD family transcriptional regulator/tetratricopeptide (TPR) repeat protein
MTLNTDYRQVGHRGSAAAAPELIGRDRQLEAVRGLFDAGQPAGVAVLVSGEPGAGKSALLDAAGEAARRAGFRTLRTAGVEAETELGFSGLHQLLLPLLGGSGQLPEPQRRALAAAFGSETGGEAGSTPEQFLVSLAALSLLSDAAAERPVAVLADDVQWLDMQTQRALAFLARRIAMDRVVMVAAVRSGHDGPYVSAGLPQIEIPALDNEASARLLRESDGWLDARWRERILAEADGNPLALIELTKASRPAVGTAGLPPAVLPVTARLERSFAGRMNALPAACRDVLLVAAVDSGDDLAEVLAGAALLSGAEVKLDQLEAGVRAGLLVIDEARVRFRHPLIRSSVLRSEPVHRRLRANGVLADVLAGEPHRQVWYRAQSIVGQDDAVAGDLVASVDVMMSRGSAIAAIRCLERAAQLTSDPGQRGRRLLLAAEHAFGLGRMDLVSQLVRAALQFDLSDLERSRLEWLGEIFHDGVPGDASRVLEICGTAERAAAARDRDLALNLLHGAALRCWWADAGENAPARVTAVLAGLEGAEADPRYACALAVAEPVRQAAAVVGLLSGFAAQEIADADSLRLLGMAAHAIGHSPMAADFLDRSEAMLRQQGRLGLLSHVLAMQAGIRLGLGCWDRASAAAAEARRLALDTGQPIWSTAGLVGESRAAALRGETDQALRLAALAEQEASGGRLNDLLACVQLARGYAWSSARRYEEAYAELRRLYDEADPSCHVRESYPGLMFLADAAVHIGRHHDAREVVGRFEALARSTPSEDLRVSVGYARAVLASDADAEELYAAALAADLVRWPWVRSRTELAFGSWLRRHRRVAESRGYLRSALATFGAIGAGSWAEQARSELRAAGERTRERARSARQLLSAQELQIARLAADGMSNRQIGEQLYLSPRTVGSHLYRIFPKLDITSRAQLARRLEKR